MATFYNQATLNIGNTSIPSNVTEGELLSTLSITKTAATTSYKNGSDVTYVVTVTNTGTNDTAPLTIIDNLGEFSPSGECTGILPLNYVTGSLLYYVNGTPTTPPTVTAETPLTIGGVVVPGGGNVTLVYTGEANEFADLTAGSQISNTVAILGFDDASDTATVPVDEYTDLSITKSLCPSIVGSSGEITYTFIIQNSGNASVAATDNLTVTDVFTPALTNITVTVNGDIITENVGYTYDETTGEFATLGGALPVSAATFTRDSTTCRVTLAPGYTTLVVTGTI